MEADWEVEIGAGAPIIDACWEGFVDLLRAPELAARLPESVQLPALSGVLTRLNSGISPVWTSKCDVWTPEEFDRDELDAGIEEGKYALASYIDLLPRGYRLWNSPGIAVAECQLICAQLRNLPLGCCRADLIVRQAHTATGPQELGITAYLTACGPTLEAARDTLESALMALVDSIVPADPASKLQ